MDFVSFTGTEKAYHCLLLPHLGNKAKDDDKEDNTDEHTILVDTATTTIISYEHHKVFDGQSLLLTVIWDIKQDNDGPLVPGGGTMNKIGNNFEYGNV
jgi:hypothetical protein